MTTEEQCEKLNRADALLRDVERSLTPCQTHTDVLRDRLVRMGYNIRSLRGSLRALDAERCEVTSSPADS